MTSRRLPVALSFILAAAIPACAADTEEGPPPNRAPVIDRADAPAEVTATSGKYVVAIKLEFHDDDNDAVTKLRLRIPAGSFDATTPIQNAVPQAVGATISLELLASTVTPGTYECSLSVFDSKGLESAPVTKQITLK